MDGYTMRLEHPVYFFIESVQMLNMFENIGTEDDIKAARFEWQTESIIRNDRKNRIIQIAAVIEVNGLDMVAFAL